MLMSSLLEPVLLAQHQLTLSARYFHFNILSIYVLRLWKLYWLITVSLQKNITRSQFLKYYVWCMILLLKFVNKLLRIYFLYSMKINLKYLCLSLVSKLFSGIKLWFLVKVIFYGYSWISVKFIYYLNNNGQSQ